MSKLTCDKGYKGTCCCLCKHRIEVMCHPKNEVGRGGVNKIFGYGCNANPDCEDGIDKNRLIFFDSPHGACELFNSKY